MDDFDITTWALRRASQIMREEGAALTIVSSEGDPDTVALASKLLGAAIADAIVEGFKHGVSRRGPLN